MKKLEILVPQYKEGEDIVKDLLNSIAIQQGIDFNDIGVIIVNDGTDILLSDVFLNSYNFDIKYLKNEKNMGISYTRNKAFDESTAEYVMYCDDDDMFSNVLGIYTIFEYIDKIDEFGYKGFDVFTPIFKQELKDDKTGKKIYFNVTKEDTFIHGKVYRRKYLLDNNIRFNDKIPINEDVYFNVLALTLTDKIVNSSNCFYLWKYNEKSVTKSKNNFVVDTIETIITCYYETIKELIKRGLYKQAAYNTVYALYRIYYESQTKKFIDNPDRLAIMEKMIRKLYLDFKKMYEINTEENKINILKKMKVEFLEKGVLFEKNTFDSWINHLMEDYND